MGMPELALDDDQRHALMGHLYRVRVTQLMRGEPTPDAGGSSDPTQLAARGRWLPLAPGGRAMDHAQQLGGARPGRPVAQPGTNRGERGRSRASVRAALLRSPGTSP